MRVRIVCYQKVESWILGKFAQRLCENLQKLDVQADIGSAPDPMADINHHISFVELQHGDCAPVGTVMITHVNSEEELGFVRHQIESGIMGVCISRDTLNKLVTLGIPRCQLCYVMNPHDEVMRPRRLKIGITSNMYADGRKREILLTMLADKISPDDFQFQIMGHGWDLVVDELRSKGFSVDHWKQFDYERYCELIPNLDYYLYLGLDEGTTGMGDALYAGVKTILTPQGFHLDAVNGVTFFFKDIEDLTQIFYEIAEERNTLRRAVATWNWCDYAKAHLTIWEYLLKKNNASKPPITPELFALGIADGAGVSSDSRMDPLPVQSYARGISFVPRILVVGDMPNAVAKENFDQFIRTPPAGSRPFTVIYAGDPTANRALPNRQKWELKYVDIRQFDADEVVQMSFDFDAVYLINLLDLELIKKLNQRVSPVYALKNWMMCLATKREDKKGGEWCWRLVQLAKPLMKKHQRTLVLLDLSGCIWPKLHSVHSAKKQQAAKLVDALIVNSFSECADCKNGNYVNQFGPDAWPRIQQIILQQLTVFTSVARESFFLRGISFLMGGVHFLRGKRTREIIYQATKT